VQAACASSVPGSADVRIYWLASAGEELAQIVWALSVAVALYCPAVHVMDLYLLTLVLSPRPYRHRMSIILTCLAVSAPCYRRCSAG
jgi:pyruvate/2-oxoacid:ferredoxin oxidoreductase alpha subunit